MDFWYQYHGPVPKVWPRRLLDIVSMTSFERQEGNVYGGFTEPRYSIISYTWGRFALENPHLEAPRLDVRGVTWPIPAIDPAYFTTDLFLQMIQRTREISGNRFVWLDIACIDQQDYATKMEEVGRQAGIFANAGVAFVWLWQVPTDVVQESWSLWQWLMGQDRESPISDPKMVVALGEAVLTLLGDRWFSSLWTLEEERLRTDAVILSRDGVSGEKSSEALQYTLTFMHFGFNKIFSKLKESQVEETRDLAERVRHCIQNAGYMSVTGSNPNLAFTTAYLRQATNQLDRIYGIIALYNIQVGATIPGADTTRQYTLEELEEEFVVALNAKSVFLGQLFVHTERPKETWRITQRARVPEGFEDWDSKFVTIDCALVARPGAPARIRGKIASFESVIMFWRARMPQLTRVDRDYHLTVVVDDYVCREQPALPYSEPQNQVQFRNSAGDFFETEKTVYGLLETYEKSRLSVLRLGGTSFGPGRPDVYGDVYGLLILHNEDDRLRCQRIGLCRWEGESWDWQLSEDVKELRPLFRESYDGEIY